MAFNFLEFVYLEGVFNYEKTLEKEKSNCDKIYNASQNLSSNLIFYLIATSWLGDRLFFQVPAKLHLVFPRSHQNHTKEECLSFQTVIDNFAVFPAAKKDKIMPLRLVHIVCERYAMSRKILNFK